MVTDKKVERLENASVKLTITLGKDSVKKEYADTVLHYSKSAQVKGFRKGKVPLEVMERKFGPSLRAEALQKLLENGLKEVLEDIEEQPLPYAQPTLTDEDIDLNPEEDLTFSVQYDVFPTIEPGEYTGLEVEEPQVEVGDEDLERELKAIQEQNAMVQEVTDTPVEKDHIVTVDFWEVDADGNPVPDSERQDFVFTVGSGYNFYNVDEDVIGMKPGEEKTVTKEYAEDYSFKEIAGTTKTVQIRLKTVKKRDMPELDDELAQDVSDKYKTLQDLKDDIRKRMVDTAEARVRETKSNNLVKKIVEGATLDVPDSMVRAELSQFWQDFIRQTGSTEENVMKMLTMQGKSPENLFEEWRPNAIERLKGRLVLGKIMEAENVEVTDEELEESIRERAEESGMELEEFKGYLEQQNMTEYLRDQLRETKLFDQLFEKSKIVKGEKVKFLDLMQRKS